MVSGYITNIGVGPANPPFNTDFFLSIDDQFQGDGVEQGDLQGIFINHVINVGDTFFFTAPVFSEEVTQPGPYYFLAVVDEGQDVFELTKANNVSSTPVYIQSVACYYNLDFNADTIDYNQTFGNWNVVHTEENCSWWSSENSSWISGTTDPVSSPTTGNGSTTYFPSINHSPYPRTATITIMNNTVTVYQNGCPIMPAELGQDIVFCNSATLNAALDTSQTIFTWSTGATSPNISVNSTGLYSVTITNSYGCITSDTIQVTISNSSTAPTSVTTSQNPTCYGNSVLLSQSGGVLGQAYEWKWYSGSCGGSLMGTGSQVLVSPNGTSQYFVRAEGCDTTACTPITITTLSLPAIDAGIDVTINEGDTTLLTASGGISYLWSTGDITATTSVSPIATSYFYVRGSDNNGCETIDSVLVTVVHNCSNLVASITPSGATSFCFGGNVTLAANAGMASYLWSNGDTAQSITVSQSGNFYVAITDNFSCPATSQSISITVNALPYADAGIDQSVCNGSSVSIGSPQTPGYTYTWSPSTTLNNSQMAMPFATPTAQTTYELTVTNSFGCTATDQTSISINALPNVTANTTANTVCNGASITLTGGGASTYTWSNGVTDGVAFIPSATVTYTVTGTDANGCQNTATNLVSILAAPTASISYNNNGYTYNFSSNIQGNATTFSWDFGDSDTSILENPVHTYSQVGSFTVTLTVSNICGSNTYQQTININPNCTYTVSQNTVVADSNGTSQAITVTCGVSCLWNVNIGNCSWLAVFPLNGAGLDSFTITIPATTDTFVRQCTLTVEGQAISVTQYGKQGSISCAPIDTSVQVNGGCDLAAATISGATYQWYKNGGQISNAISQYYTATQNGYYHVRIAVGNCAYQSGDRYLTCDTATGIDGSAVSNLKVYPNPTDGTFVINGEAKNAVKIAVNLYDMLGQIVYAKNIPLKGTIINEEIRVENLSTGIYHLQLLIDKQFYNQKLLVK
jgi:PKD repeat protein